MCLLFFVSIVFYTNKIFNLNVGKENFRLCYSVPFILVLLAFPVFFGVKGIAKLPGVTVVLKISPLGNVLCFGFTTFK